jgi:glucokinase
MLLVGDLGGTKANLAIVSEQNGPRNPVAEATLASARYSSFTALLSEFLRATGQEVSRAVFGVAGPVIGGHADITNLEWDVNAEAVKDRFGLSAVHLLNDLAAVSYGIPLLAPDELYTLNAGAPAPGGALGVIAPGTGLGEGFLVWDGARYVPQPSEGGHASFSPVTVEQIGLLAYLQDRYGHISAERVCSGSGIPNLYDYLRDSGHWPEPEWLARELARSEDRTPVIMQAALDRDMNCVLCRETLRLFVEILGAEAGNLALKVMSTGGMYLAGGIPPRILPLLINGPFLDAFTHKGRMSDLLEPMPVHVVLNPKTALLGAGRYGLEELPG